MVYVLPDPRLSQDIWICQYRRMSKSLVMLDPMGTVACCSPLSAEPLSAEQAELVASHAGGEACVCDLNDAFDLSQPTISHHLKVLYEAGLLDREKRGVWVYYCARTNALLSLGALIGCPST